MIHIRSTLRGNPLVAKLEDHFFASAPALSATLHSSGWLLRSSAGYTKRGNSASPLSPSAPLCQSTLPQIQSGLPEPNIIRITPLAHPDDDSFLDRLGWRCLDPSVVMVRKLDGVDSSVDAGSSDVSVSSVPSPAWIDGFASSSSLTPSQTSTFRNTLNLIHPPFTPAYLTLTDKSTLATIAYGQAVTYGGIAGLFNIVVPATHRGKGHGRRITQALLDWAGQNGADMAYLQVTQGNAVGKKLYESMGFKEEYRYHYRVAP